MKRRNTLGDFLNGRFDPTFTVAVPLFNHEEFVGRTVDSVISQSYQSWELCISDNCSTDGSLDQVRMRNDPRIHVRQTHVNIGFAPNLDVAVSAGSAPWVILLSSDDVVESTALEVYSRIIDDLSPEERDNVVLTSAMSRIDEHDTTIFRGTFPSGVLGLGAPDADVSARAGQPVVRIPAKRLLGWAMATMRNPLPFASTCYPRSLWEATGGYLGSRTQSPDKWFHWRLLGLARDVLVVENSLFKYRVHSANKKKALNNARSLRHLIDEYLTVLEVDAALLESAGMSRDDLMKAFLVEDIAKRAVIFAISGQVDVARRYLRFGAAVEGADRWRSPMWWAAKGVVMTGPLSAVLLKSRVRDGTARSTFHSVQ